MHQVTKLVSELLARAPTKEDRAFRAYALNAALKADEDGTEFMRLIASIMAIANDAQRQG